MPSVDDPMALLAADRERASDLDDPLGNLCVLATVDEQGLPALRTLVVRGIDARSVRVFINRGSPKWAELRARGHFELLCYYATLGVQYRLRGGVAEYDVDEVRRSWTQKPYRTRLLDWYYEHERPQSAALESREELVAGHGRMRALYPDPEAVPVPDGGARPRSDCGPDGASRSQCVASARTPRIHEGGWSLAGSGAGAVN